MQSTDQWRTAAAVALGAAAGLAAAQLALAAFGPRVRPRPSAVPATPEGTAAARVEAAPLRVELLLHNVAKPRNLDNAVRCAAALGVDRVVLVGQRKEKAAEAARAKGVTVPIATVKYMSAVHDFFGRGAEEPAETAAVVFAGLEIVRGAVDATEAAATVRRRFPLCRTVVVVPGNEGQGMSELERGLCDMFAVVRQDCRVDLSAAAAGGAGSLNVNTATAVALQQLIARKGC